MTKLIFETFNLVERYGCYESFLKFYPNGLKGLIVDYLNNCLESTCSCTVGERSAEAFLENALNLYRESPEYSRHGKDNIRTQIETVIMMVVMEVGNVAKELFEQYETEFEHARLDIDTIQWGHDYMLVEMDE